MKKTLLLFLIFSGFQITANCLKTDIAKYNHTVSLKTDGALSACRGNSEGELNHDTNTDKNVLHYLNGTAPLIATITQSDVSCNGMANGSATVMPSGGTAPYSYLWSNGKTTATITGLAPGTYSCTVTDAASTSIQLSVAVTQPDLLVSTAAITNLDCNGNHMGSITVTATGGTAPYVYDLYTNGIIYQTSNVFTDLPSGIYEAHLKDSNGCIVSNSISITPTNSPPPTANAQTLNNTSTVANLQATGSNLKWYNGVTGGIALDLSATLQTGKYYVSQTVDGCESTRTAVDVTINKIYTLIPDIKFENKLISLGIDSGVTDGKVLTSSISSLTYLDLYPSNENEKINDLTGIQDFVALKTLMCDNHYLTTLDVTKNTALTLLSCSQNKLTTLDLSKNINLTDLQTGFNPLKQLDLSKNLLLTKLESNYSQLTTLDLSQNNALSYLSCFKNQLTTLDLSQNKLLTFVNCHDNLLISLNVTGLNALANINCLNNQLTSLDVSTNTGLKSLYCYSNKLKSLDLSKNAVLNYIACHSNELTYLNLKNGNNTNFVISTDTKFTNNPNLTCIQVDDVTYANTNWVSLKDATANYSTNCPPIYTLIPDVNFENKLISLSIDSGVADGKVLTNSINKVTSLGVRSSSIADLTGIQDFTALQTLDCFDNKLTTLDLSNNIQLSDLNCDKNQLNTLDISKNVLLTEFSCESNQLNTLDVFKNVNLVSIYCRENKLSTIDLSQNINLVRLWCGTNQMASLDVSKNTKLASFMCYENKLTTLDVSKNINLNMLNCWGNELTALNVSQNALLRYLYCSSNLLSALDVSKNVLLKEFGVSANPLTSLDVSQNINLTYLDCSYNQLTTLDVSKNPNLTNFYCDDNSLINLNLKNGANTILKKEELDFTNNPNLSCILVDDPAYANTNWMNAKDATTSYSTHCTPYTPIPDLNFENKLISLGIDSGVADGKVLTSSVSSLTSLDVSSSAINDLTGIQDFLALKSLTCENNKLTTLDVTQNIALTQLYCSQNQIVTLDVSKNVDLTSLVCNSNLLKGLDVSKNINLSSLECYSNQLTTLDFSNNVNLISLHCNKNSLSSLNLKNGHNIAFDKTILDFKENPNLSCILVDDIAYANNNWLSAKDVAASYNIDCRQYTLIPDLNFENKLIALGIDSGVADGKVLTENVALVTSLNVSSSNIVDLTGIQDFTALTELICRENNLTTLDVSKNVQLTDLNCPYNKLTSLDITKNVNLINFDCSTNQITALDVTKNVNLHYLYCNYNKLSTIDVSKNLQLTRLICISNQLTSLDVSKNVNLNLLACENNSLLTLNLKNGNNIGLDKTLIDFRNNPNLTCIQVDDVTYSNSNWASIKDVTANYATNCTPYTLIPDLNFENKLIALGIDSGVADGKVLTSRVSFLTSLNVSSSSITDLTGIQDFLALKSLMCENNKLTTLDVSKNTALTLLYCSQNQLATLDVSKNSNLEDLQTGFNPLKQLDLSKNLVLTHLECYKNQLTTLDLSQNKALNYLDCFSNQLTTLDLSQNKLLTIVYCYDNQLTSFNVTGLTALTDIDCPNNLLTSLDVSTNTGLKGLHCYSNKLKSLDLSKNVALTDLICHSNELTYLNLKNGNNTNFVVSTYTKFINNPNLTCIQVDNATYSNTNWANIKDATANYSTDCTPYTLIPDSNFEDKLIALAIDKDGKNGKVATASINQVTFLDVADSNISDLTGLQDFTTLIYFFCDRNKITTVDFSKNLMLENIGVLENSLTSIDVSKNTKLHTLEFSKNQITSVDLSQNINLKRLGFENNKLTQIDLSNNPELWFVSCFGNQLTSLDVSKNTALTYLNCSSNNLSNLNLKNSNNTLLTNSNIYLSGNPNLSCILVDDETYSNTNWAKAKDTTATYSTDCTPYTLIPDINFENKLIALGIDSGVADGKVPTANIDKLTSLNVAGSTIFNLTGIQDFKSLKELICNANRLTSLDISKNLALTSLECNVNRITALDVSKNVSLESLNCQYNDLTSLDVTNNLSLKTLFCYKNQLTSLDVSKNLLLDVLFFGYNKITAIDVSKNTLLTRLSAGYNNLTAVDISKNTALTFFACESNQISNLDISKNIRLSAFNCNDNLVTTLDVSNNNLLYEVDCKNNKLLFLNLKNGNKTNLSINYLNFTGNPDLTCIQVDDVAYANTNWANVKDATASYSTDCTPAYTLIPDANFENKLIALGIDSGTADGKVLTSKISSVTSLDVTSSLISNLTGIQDFTSLKELICNANNLTTLNVSKNLALTRLECENNKLAALDVSKNLSLETFKCGVNNLTFLDVSNNLSLTTLYCNTNQLSNLDVSKNLQLTALSFDYNTIAVIDVSKNTSLRYLTFRSNNITTIDTSKNNLLGTLDCQSNQISNLDMSNNLILNTLACNNNQITSLDVSKHVYLVFLLCQNNKLTNLNLKNGNNTKFDTKLLNFTGNPNLSCIQVDNVTYSNTNWANLKDITANYSTDCNTAYALIPNSNFEQKLIDLGIDTDGLNGKISTTSIESITSLDLSNTNITDLSGIENFTALKSFTANGNNLTSVNFSKNLMLEYISINGNNLTSLDLSKNTNLRALEVANNQLSLIDVSKNTNLSELDFSNNKVTQIDLSQNKELTVLNALGNQLTTLDISQNPKLKSLNVEFNQLTSLNLQNGNNVNFVLAKPTTKLAQTVVYTSFLNNPYLSCIKVDNVAYSNQNWSKIKDATTIYSATCSTLGIEDSVFDKVTIYPNPVKDELHIDNIVLEKATVYDALGKLVKTTKFSSGANDNTIQLEGFPKGVYYIYLESEGNNTAKKIIVE